jgi:hypothetical protein
MQLTLGHRIRYEAPSLERALSSTRATLAALGAAFGYYRH